ncbi:hypothetical protein OJ253_3502 [Cryptosporidium canis]|uniref:Uncharacterized protein n=1 Tax=Cryptosporidium canis TaxID=195482 RepID=A0A9D5HW47_9CRYT|nr:hypothetical protein OJ253_3502 [Cryptosporidium canis]
MERSLGSLYERGGYCSDDLANAYDVLSYLDDISPEEMRLAGKLVSEELQAVLREVGEGSSGLGDGAESAVGGVEQQREEEREEDREEEREEDREEEREGYSGAIETIKRIGTEIEYGYVARVNLQLLKEFGGDAWDDQVRRLERIKQRLQMEQKELNRIIKQISINRKRRQMEFRDSQLGPLLDDLRRVRSENDSLSKLLVKVRKESTE